MTDNVISEAREALHYMANNGPYLPSRVMKITAALDYTKTQAAEIDQLRTKLAKAEEFISAVAKYLPDKDQFAWTSDPYDPDPPLEMANPRKAAAQFTHEECKTEIQRLEHKLSTSQALLEECKEVIQTFVDGKQIPDERFASVPVKVTVRGGGLRRAASLIEKLEEI